MSLFECATRCELPRCAVIRPREREGRHRNCEVAVRVKEELVLIAALNLPLQVASAEVNFAKRMEDCIMTSEDTTSSASIAGACVAALCLGAYVLMRLSSKAQYP